MKDSWHKDLREKIQEILEYFFIAPLLDVTKETELDPKVRGELSELGTKIFG